MNITQELADSVWHEPQSWTAKDATGAQKKLIKSQKPLFAFVAARAEPLGEHAFGVMLFMFTIVYRMYRKAYGRPIPKIPVSTIEKTDNETDGFFESLETDENMLDRMAVTRFGKHPEIWKYITSGIYEANDEDLDLSEEQISEMIILFKTVVDLLDEATSDA